MKAGGRIATKVYKVFSEMQVEVETFKQSDLDYDGKNIAFEPWTVQIRNPDGEFDQNVQIARGLTAYGLACSTNCIAS